MASFVSSQNSFLLSSDLIIPVFQITFLIFFNLWYQNCNTFVLLCGTNIRPFGSITQVFGSKFLLPNGNL